MKPLGLATAALVAVGLGVAAAVGAFSGGSQPPIARGKSVLARPPSRARAAISAAHASDPGLFRIFPRGSGSRRCVIPLLEGLRESRVGGTCRTRVTHPVRHGLPDEVSVTFSESWADHRSWWTLIVELPAAKVVATHLHGAPAPQLRYATDAVQGAVGRV